MGVPRLFSFLQPFGVTKILGCDEPSCNAHPKSLLATIDGPALAYHVYYRLLSHAKKTSNILDDIPSYRDISKGVLEYLNGLHDCGLIIDTIYFDGYLHQHKQETREERCAAALRDLTFFCATNLKGFQPVDANAVNADVPQKSLLFQSSEQRPSRFRGPPPPPFLVPVALEAIMRSRFAHITNVVAGEADLFCAMTACSKGALILTNDSDLLLYDLGSEGAVCFLQSIEVTKSSESRQHTTCQILRSSVLRPQDIMKRLGLQNLGCLAFQLSRDSHISFNTAVRRAAEKPTVDALTWTQMYDVKAGFLDDASIQLNPVFESGKCRLDPRVSELVLRILLHSEARDGRIFLPLLLEDPHRVSAWTAACSIRLLAYQCLDIGRESSPFIVIENMGRASASVNKVVGISNAKNGTDATALELVNKIEEARKACRGMEGDFFSWRVFALTWTRTWLIGSHKNAPSKSDVTHVLCGSKGAHRNWSALHLMAQVHGVLYSLSMLRQILNYQKVVQEKALSLALQRTASTLCGLPTLPELLMSDRELGQRMAKYPPKDVLNVFNQAIHEE